MLGENVYVMFNWKGQLFQDDYEIIIYYIGWSGTYMKNGEIYP